MIKELLAKVSAKQDLTFDEAKQAIDEIMSGEVSEAVISSFLTALANERRNRGGNRRCGNGYALKGNGI